MDAPLRLGKYEIRREIGRGAMGVVYEGIDTTIHRRVAIKVLRADPADAATFAEVRVRFKREAQAAGQLNHPGIVAVYDYGEGDGSSTTGLNGPFIAMAFVAGQDLKSILQQGPRFTLAQTGTLMKQLLAALQHAHDHGVIHRDIKPANLIWSEGDQLKLADLGIARVPDSDLTRTGAVIGTAAYMSPEQLTGAAVDHRTDLYACGVLLYELLTGEPPFLGSTTTIIQKVLNQEPLPPSMVNPALPRRLDEVLRTALAKKSGQRFPTADAFSAAIAAALEGVDDDATVVMPIGRTRRAHWPAVAVTVGVAAGVAALALATFFWSRSPSGEAGSRPIETARPGGPPTELAHAPDPPVSLDNAAPQRATHAVPAGPASAVSSASDTDVEQRAWDESRKADSLPAYNAYLKEFPRGRFTKVARIRIAALAPRPAAGLPGATATVRAAPAVDVASAFSSASPGAPIRSPTFAAAVASAPASSPTIAKADVPEKPGSAAATQRSAEGVLAQCQARAQAGDKACQLRLGAAYRSGRDLPQDHAMAMRWFLAAAAQGDAAGQFEVGAIYFDGRGTRQDHREAIQWLRKAADQNHAAAQDLLGRCYERGLGIRPSPVIAADWYRKSAELGHVAGQNNLGRAYLFGIGVFKDPARAKQWFDKGSAQGSADAAFNLGYMFETGAGVPMDPTQASRWYRTALGRPNLHAGTRDRARAEALVAAHP